MRQSKAFRNVKAAIAPALIPPTRACMRYGFSGGVKRTLWNKIGRRIQSFNHPFEVATRFGFRFAGNTEELVASYIYYFGIWEPAITRWICQLPLRGRTIIDVGAHFGWYTLLGSTCVGPEGLVVSIEPSPANLARLRHNIDLNSRTNIRLVNSAVWNEFGELNLYPGPESNAGKTTVVSAFMDRYRGAEPSASTITVSSAPLSALLRPEEISAAALVKIDVEGAEEQVVEGMIPLLPRFPEDVRFVVELSPEVFASSGGTGRDLLDIFRDYGFRPYVIRNEYTADFYLDSFKPQPFELNEVKEPITRQTDVVLSRLPLRNEILP